LNYVGSTDGDIIISFKPTEYFPKYGGRILIDVPVWYDKLSKSVYTFEKAKCVAPEGFVVSLNPFDSCNDKNDFSSSPPRFIFDFSRYDPSKLVGGMVNIKC